MERTARTRLGPSRLSYPLIKLCEHDVMRRRVGIERDGGMEFRFGLPLPCGIVGERAAVESVIVRLAGREADCFGEICDGHARVLLFERKQPTLKMLLGVCLLRRGVCARSLRLIKQACARSR